MKFNFLNVPSFFRVTQIRMSISSTLPEPLSGKDTESYAYITIKDRLPVILTKVIDTLHRDRYNIGKDFGEAAKEETTTIIGRLSKLQNEMVTNKPIVPLESTGPDVLLWNEYLKKQAKLYGFAPAWFDSPWLYVECYLYRRIKEALELSTYLQNYDPFKNQKNSSFLSSHTAVLALSLFLQKATSELNSRQNKDADFDYFEKFIKVSLWGNKCDLSLSAGEESIQTSDPLLQLSGLDSSIVVNEIDRIWNILEQANRNHRGSVRIDIVLDNAGFELFTDLCFVEILEDSGLIDIVYLYVKTLPWFVSDTLDSDISWLLQTLSKSSEEPLTKLGNKWEQKIATKKWIIEKEMFWTLPHDYSEMQEMDFQLYSKLSRSDLIIFKGDLNYRKLASDRKWDVTVPFITSLRGFLPAPLCSLRTVKCEVLAGLKPGIKEEIDKISPNWMITGNYAVIQCASKNRNLTS